MKTLLAFMALVCLAVPARADFEEVSRLSEKEAIDYFVAHGGGYVQSDQHRYDDGAKWIDIEVRANLPDHFDLREKHPTGDLQPVKRQRCGDCWAHSVLAVVEAGFALKYPDEPFRVYAQQEMISSCGHTGGSCNGGDFPAFDYVVGKNGPGLPLEEDLPYQGHGTSCNHEVEKLPRANTWAYVGKRWALAGPTIEQMKQALVDYGVLSVDVHAFNHSGGDVYTSCSSGATNHMVNIVGWQDDADVQGGGYWYVRNSWGESFGEGGYAKVAFTDRSGKNKCSALGRVTAVVTELDDATPYHKSRRYEGRR